MGKGWGYHEIMLVTPILRWGMCLVAWLEATSRSLWKLPKWRTHGFRKFGRQNFHERRWSTRLGPTSSGGRAI